jgi:hypothetical protein
MAANGAENVNVSPTATAWIVEDGKLIIEGHEGGDVVSVTGIGTGTGVFDVTTQQGTQRISGVTRDILINLHGGDDTLEMNNVHNESLVISTGPGADVVRLGAFEAYARSLTSVTETSGQVDLTGGLSIDTGPGADLVQAIRVFSVGDWDINLGDTDGTTNNTDRRQENDLSVNLDDQFYIFIGSGNAIDITGGTGDDLVNINYLISNAALSIAGDLGNDVLSVNGCAFKADVGLFGGGGFDTVAIDFSRHDAGLGARLTLDGGNDADFIFLARSLIERGQVMISAGAGFDHVVVGRYYANAQGDLTTGGNALGKITVDTDLGNDRVDIRGNVVAEFFGTFGGEADDVDFINNVVRNQGLLDGGFNIDGLTFFGNLVSGFGTLGFENPNNTFFADIGF